MVKAESAETGHVKLKVYLAYFKSLSYTFSIMFVGFIALQEVNSLALIIHYEPIHLVNVSTNVTYNDDHQILKYQSL